MFKTGLQKNRLRSETFNPQGIYNPFLQAGWEGGVHWQRTAKNTTHRCLCQEADAETH